MGERKRGRREGRAERGTRKVVQGFGGQGRAWAFTPREVGALEGSGQRGTEIWVLACAPLVVTEGRTDGGGLRQERGHQGGQTWGPCKVWLSNKRTNTHFISESFQIVGKVVDTIQRVPK